MASISSMVGINEEKRNDPNELCDNLRILLNSQAAGDMSQLHEINSIIAKLYELEILL